MKPIRVSVVGRARHSVRAVVTKLIRGRASPGRCNIQPTERFHFADASRRQRAAAAEDGRAPLVLTAAGRARHSVRAVVVYPEAWVGKAKAESGNQ